MFTRQGGSRSRPFDGTGSAGALADGGWLAVVTFHSIEDRIVKRYLQAAAGSAGGGSRHAPEQAATEPRFELKPRKAIAPAEAELAANPRARSARLRIARRTGALVADRAADQDESGRARVIADYVAGMTDRYAMKAHDALQG